MTGGGAICILARNARALIDVFVFRQRAENKRNLKLRGGLKRKRKNKPGERHCLLDLSQSVGDSF